MFEAKNGAELGRRRYQTGLTPVLARHPPRAIHPCNMVKLVLKVDFDIGEFSPVLRLPNIRQIN